MGWKWSEMSDTLWFDSRGFYFVLCVSSKRKKNGAAAVTDDAIDRLIIHRWNMQNASMKMCAWIPAAGLQSQPKERREKKTITTHTPNPVRFPFRSFAVALAIRLLRFVSAAVFVVDFYLFIYLCRFVFAFRLSNCYSAILSLLDGIFFYFFLFSFLYNIIRGFRVRFAFCFFLVSLVLLYELFSVALISIWFLRFFFFSSLFILWHGRVRAGDRGVRSFAYSFKIFTVFSIYVNSWFNIDTLHGNFENSFIFLSLIECTLNRFGPVIIQYGRWFIPWTIFDESLFFLLFLPCCILSLVLSFFFLRFCKIVSSRKFHGINYRFLSFTLLLSSHSLDIQFFLFSLCWPLNRFANRRNIATCRIQFYSFSFSFVFAWLWFWIDEQTTTTSPEPQNEFRKKTHTHNNRRRRSREKKWL